MANGSGQCGYLEKNTPCAALNETQLLGAAVVSPSGGTNYLCVVSPVLMSGA